MKQLVVMRHAKAHQPREGEDDRDRPLASRGERNAPAIGLCLKLAGLVPDRIVSSDATRARRTAQLVAAACRFEGETELLEELYGASLESLLEAIRRIPEPAGRVLLVGHNPGLEQLVWGLCQGQPATLPGAGLRLATGAAVLLELAADLWDRVEPGCGRIEWSLPPRLVQAINPKL